MSAITTVDAPHRAAFLPGERRLLASPTLAAALDGGLIAAAELDGDPATLLHIALLEMAGGRFADGAARAQAVAKMTDDPDLVAFAETAVALAASWADLVLPLSIPEPGSDHLPAHLLRLALIVQQWALEDAPRTGRTWDEIDRLLDRVTSGAEQWLRRSRGAAEFAAGLPAAVFAAFYVVHHTRSAWAAGFATRLGRAVERHGLYAWTTWIHTLTGLAHAMTGDYGTARDVLRRRLAMLNPAQAPTPPLVIMYAMLYSHAALTGSVLRFESEDVSRRLIDGPWRRIGDAAVHAAAGFLASGLAHRGELTEAARVIDAFGAIDGQKLEHTMRVGVTEIRFGAAIEAGDDLLSEALLGYAASLYASPMQVAALARMRALAGDDVDPVPPSRDTGMALDLILAHWTRLVAALRYRGRDAALRELAAFDPVAAGAGAAGLRDRAVRLFRPDTTGVALTPRRREVALLAAAGYTNDEIGEQLFLSRRTVEAHVHGALKHLRLSHRSQLAEVLLATTTAGSVGARLSPRQGQVAALIAAGCTNAEIAAALDIADKTVEQHVTALFRAFGVRNRTGVAAAFLRVHA